MATKILLNKIGFVGGGSMSSAIAGGLLKNKIVASCSSLGFGEKMAERRAFLKKSFERAVVSEDSKNVVGDCDLIFVSVKPKAFFKYMGIC